MQKQKQDAYEQNVPSVLFSRAAKNSLRRQPKTKSTNTTAKKRIQNAFLRAAERKIRTNAKKKGQRKRVWKRKDEKATKP